VIRTARRSGIESRLKSLPSLALGTSEVTPLELAAGYATLARLGRAGRPWVIREVVDGTGNVLRRPRVAWSEALSPQAAYLVNYLLRGVLANGTARSARALGYRGTASGKTGTTDDTRDAWFVGYSSHLLGLVWLGHDDGSPTGLTGATGALPIWVELMRRAGLAGGFGPDPVPDGIVERRIDPESGGLSHRGCRYRIEERFVEGTEPQRACAVHGSRFRRWFDRLRRRTPPARDGAI
jgi:penicillin-binding protein 1B